jgi:hypothetical protein
VRAGRAASPGPATPRRPETHASRTGASIVPALALGRAFDDRQVAPLDAMGPEGIDQSRAGVAREREGEGTRGVAIEPVHALGIAGVGLEAARVVLHAREDGVLVEPGRRGDAQQPRRLVHDDHVLVLVEDGERRARLRQRLQVRVERDGRRLGTSRPGSRTRSPETLT